MGIEMPKFESQEAPSAFAESEEIIARIAEDMKKVNPENLGIISQNLLAEVAKQLAKTETNQGVEYAREIAGLLFEDFGARQFIGDFEKNEEMKRLTLEYLEQYAHPELKKEAA
jgi:hypothetical protein